MRLWRSAVIQLLRAALRAGLLRIDLTVGQMEDVLVHLERCWWSVKVQSSESKDHRLRYDGRYMRRPPIAQRRITNISEQSVTFRTKDKKLGFWVEVEYSLQEFVDRWAQHISEHYQHGVRYFGLFASRKLGKISAALFATLGQKPRPRPGRLAWADSIKQDFDRDPLLDREGHRMIWVRRIAPQAPVNQLALGLAFPQCAFPFFPTLGRDSFCPAKTTLIRPLNAY